MYKSLKVLIINLILFLFLILLLELFFKIFLPQNLQGKMTELTDFGYANKSYGSSIHHFNDIKVTYHYSYPNLRKSFFNKNKENILILGDSFTFGYLLNIENTFVRKIENCFLQKYNFLNAATGGYGLSNNVGYTEKYISDLNPKKIIYFLNTTDIGRSYLNQIYTYKNNRLLFNKFSQDKKKSFKKFISNIPFYEYLIENSHFFQFIRKQLHSKILIENKNVVSVTNRMINDADILGRNLFLKLNSIAKNNESELIVVSIGFDRFSSWSKLQEKLSKKFYKNKENFFGTNMISFVDLGDDLVEQSDNNLKNITIKDDGHPNINGASIIGKSACKKLSDIIK